MAGIINPEISFQHGLKLGEMRGVCRRAGGLFCRREKEQWNPVFSQTKLQPPGALSWEKWGFLKPHPKTTGAAELSPVINRKATART